MQIFVKEVCEVQNSASGVFNLPLTVLIIKVTWIPVFRPVYKYTKYIYRYLLIQSSLIRSNEVSHGTSSELVKHVGWLFPMRLEHEN